MVLAAVRHVSKWLFVSLCPSSGLSSFLNLLFFIHPLSLQSSAWTWQKLRHGPSRWRWPPRLHPLHLLPPLSSPPLSPPLPARPPLPPPLLSPSPPFLLLLLPFRPLFSFPPHLSVNTPWHLIGISFTPPLSVPLSLPPPSPSLLPSILRRGRGRHGEPTER